MIVQSKETPAKKSLIDLLGANTKTSGKSNDAFSKLLSAFGMNSDESKVSKRNEFKAVIDPKNSMPQPVQTKNSIPKNEMVQELKALLSGDEKESILVSKELLSSLSDDQVRTLIHKAKEFLKNEITQKAPDYQSDTAKLPKSLIGLVQLAQKLGLEPESITLSKFVTEPEEKNSLSLDILSKPLLESKMLAILPSVAPTTSETTPFEAITQLLSEIKGKEQKSSKTTSSETASVHKHSDDKTESQPLKTLLQSIENRSDNTSTNPKEGEKGSEIKPSASATPKMDSLTMLLQGESESKHSHGDSTLGKTDVESSKSVATPKAADSIEVKSKEAQQSMRLFASDLKEAVQDYKPPFTRLTMKLNPEKLGEVEVTLVQRGNNVHVNIQSNNTTSVAFLAQNATELKAQLAQHGITNATMNFMSNGENQQNHAQQQHQHEQRQNAFRSYESFEDLELNEEQITALEIIIPHYA